MNNKIKIENQKFEDYLNKYDYRFNFKKNKLYSLEDIKKNKRGRFYKVLNDEKYCYVKLPFLTKKAFTSIAIGMCALIAGGIAAPIGIMYMPKSVSINSSCLEIVSSNTARLANDYKCTFKIKDDVIKTRYMDNININSIKVDGVEIPVEGYSFIYQTNAKNELTINKRYLTGKVEINADLVERYASQNCFYFEYDVEEFADFNDMEILYPEANKCKDYTGIDDSKTKSSDNIYLKDGVDLVKVKTTDRSSCITFEKNVFIIREDNTFKIKLNAKEGKILPNNIWFRSNARFTLKNVDFTINFSNDKKSAVIEVPYFFVRDNGSIRINPSVQG